ncbi:PDZ domain-containing protein [Streptomyces sp. Tu 3180]|uniref:PDZ domain-containing protein n=1 Tax=Streptomyces sp. Tu 3180 TaxID=2682611 RepID=UPI00326151D0
MGAAVVGAGGTAEPERRAGEPAAAVPASPRAAPAAAAAPPAPVVARLGVEVADDGRPGAVVVGVHVPGPGFSAGLVRGDVLLAFGGTRVDSAAGLARAVARARPGAEVTLTVRHRGGGHQRLTVVPGIVT